MARCGTLLLVGCGKMGGALLEGWLSRGIADRYVVVEPSGGAEAFRGRDGVSVVADAADLPADLAPDAIMLAVKPQSMGAVAPAYARYAAGGAVYVSIAAGTRLAFFEDTFGRDAAIVRVMPNTPAAVGRGMSVLLANAAVPPPGRDLAAELMAAVGETAWIEDEALMDAVTAVSGSGPAYVFLLIETLAAAGVAAGLPPALADQLARATVAGSGELARLSAEDAATLRKNVTSPGGTTAAALSVLMAPDGLAPLMTRAVAAATARGRELGG